MNFGQKISKFFSEDMAIDLGTANSVVYVQGRGIVIFEPSVVAVNQKPAKFWQWEKKLKNGWPYSRTHYCCTANASRGDFRF